MDEGKPRSPDPDDPELLDLIAVMQEWCIDPDDMWDLLSARFKGTL